MKSFKTLLGSIMAAFFPLLAMADFGLITTQQYFDVDTGAGLTFKIRRLDNGVSVQSAGDIASLTFNGVEYQNPSRGSQVNSGFDWLYSGVSAVTVDARVVENQFVVVTVKAGDLTHYYMARDGYPHIYMATYFTTEPNIHGHVRYILRLNANLLPNGPEPSNISRTVSTVEASDIFALPNGETRSKHYSNMRLKDWQFIGATGSNVGMWVVRGNQEGGSGGPFYRSLLNQGGGDQEITYIVNYGQTQTEAFRTHILNDYTFVVTDGSEPGAVDTSWFSKLDLLGYMAPSERGKVAMVAIHGRDSASEYTVGFANETAQYWTTPDSATGYFKSPEMRPGEYTMTVYKNELSVLARQVRVVAGETTILNSHTIEHDPDTDAAVWRIGTWNGSPTEFLNGDKLTIMHPSDSRIESWGSGLFTIGENIDADFPAYFWKDINNQYRIQFKLSETERQQNRMLRIGITCAFSGGRARIKVNGWQSDIKAASVQPKTRSLTTGSYRCNNTTFTYAVPASAWQTDAEAWNVLTLEVISGSGGQRFLSPAFSVDAIDLLATEADEVDEPPVTEEPEIPEVPDDPEDDSSNDGNGNDSDSATDDEQKDETEVINVSIGAVPFPLVFLLVMLLLPGRVAARFTGVNRR